MENTRQSSKEFFKLTTIIHLGLVMGVVLFGVVVYFFIIDFQLTDTQSELAKLLAYLVPGFVIVGILASNITYRIMLNTAKESWDLKNKMLGYRYALMIRCVMLEGPALFALAAIFFTNDVNFMVYSGLLVALMILKRPTLKTAIIDLELDQQEISILKDPDSAL